MKAAVLNGTRKGDVASDAVHEAVVQALAAGGWEVESLPLRDMAISHCVGCFGCWVKTPGVCVIPDAGREVARAYIRSDLAVCVTPVTFGGYSSELKKALDRIICLISPFFTKIGGEVHHKPRYSRYPCLAVVGVLPHPDAESEGIFAALAGRNAISLCAPGHAAGIVSGPGGEGAARAKIESILRATRVRR